MCRPMPRILIAKMILRCSNISSLNMLNIKKVPTSSPITTLSSSKLPYLYMMMFWVLLIMIGIILFLGSRKNHSNLKKEISDAEIQKILPNFTSMDLKEEVFSLYKKLEIAKTKNDYKVLTEITTDDFYQNQQKELQMMKTNHQKLVATNIYMRDAQILSFQKIKDKIITIVYLYVSQYDYVIDRKKKVIRGTDEAEYQIEYKLTLEKQEEDSFKIKQEECIGKWIKN